MFQAPPPIRLVPQLPPGRRDRKALAFNAEIHRMRAAGYTFEAIRLVLLKAGVAVSRTTIKREAAKPVARVLTGSPHGAFPASTLARPSAPTPATAIAPPNGIDAPSTNRSSAGGGPFDNWLSAKDLARAFCESRPSNPLVRRLMERGER